MRAAVKRAFDYPRGGTTLTLADVDGTIKPGEVVSLALPAGDLVLKVRGVGFMDFDIGRPTFHADLFILVDGIKADEVPPGTEVQTRQ